MSYSIQYNPELRKKYPKPKFHSQISYKRIIFLILLFVSVYIFAQNGWLKYLLPGDPDVTSAAISNLVVNVGEGSSIKEAVYSFCEEIITGDIE